MKEAIAIVDFGSQFTHLIANRIRRHGVYAEIFLPDDLVGDELEKLGEYRGIILSGGPNSVYEDGAPRISKKVFELGVPVLGICYGHHLMMRELGGTVRSGNVKEYGLAQLQISSRTGLFKGVSSKTQVWMSHGDEVTKLPSGFISAGHTDDCKFAATVNTKNKLYSIQFHFEVMHTREGMKMIENFLDVCKVKKSWSMDAFMKLKMAQIRERIGTRNVFLLVSGGVDSTVSYALLAKTIGSKRVYGMYVDTGLMRKDETKYITGALKKIGIKNLHVLHAGKEFLFALKGECDPEKKRVIIGDMFLKMQAKVSKELKLNPKDWVLGQGTIYPDTIESAGTKHSSKIKTHHNRVSEVLKLIKEGRIVEPIADLYKDEVRALGEKLGLPKELVWRHPFPGPGLGVRILCANKSKLPKTSHLVERKVEVMLDAEGLFGAIPPIQSVGVQGDARTYKNPLFIWGRKTGFQKLEKLSTALTNSLPEINRVCLLLTPKEIKTIKLMPRSITPVRVKLLQKLDDIVMKFIVKNKLQRKIWQSPTVLVPLSINGSKKEVVVLRPFQSEDVMSANFYKMNGNLLYKLTEKLTPHVSAVLYDITNKPPGTIEWE